MSLYSILYLLFCDKNFQNSSLKAVVIFGLSLSDSILFIVFMTRFSWSSANRLNSIFSEARRGFGLLNLLLASFNETGSDVSNLSPSSIRTPYNYKARFWFLTYFLSVFIFSLNAFIKSTRLWNESFLSKTTLFLIVDKLSLKRLKLDPCVSSSI